MQREESEAEQERERRRKRRRRKKNISKRVLDRSTMSRACGAVTWDEKQGETGMIAVHRQRGRDLPAHFTWTSVRPDSYRVTVRERKRDSETDTYRTGKAAR